MYSTQMPATMPSPEQRPRRILVVEDEPLLALAVESLLVDAGFVVVGVAGRLQKALDLVASETFDAAILDANLAGVSASPIALALADRKLPFIVVSGYAAEQLKDSFPGAILIQKPYRAAQIINTLNTLLGTP